MKGILLLFNVCFSRPSTDLVYAMWTFSYLIVQFWSAQYSGAHYIQQNKNILSVIHITRACGQFLPAVYTKQCTTEFLQATCFVFLKCNFQWKGKATAMASAIVAGATWPHKSRGDVIHDAMSTSRFPRLLFSHAVPIPNSTVMFLCHCLRVWMEEPITTGVFTKTSRRRGVVNHYSKLGNTKLVFFPGEE
jgi:hypothetical protein